MPWIRIDENAMEHPKISGLPDGTFRLWISGLAFCQKYLTDGEIAGTALRGLRSYSAKRCAELLDVGLWEENSAGVRVHDYLDWNEGRERVLKARQMARERMQKLRGCSGGSSGEQAPNVRGVLRDPPQSPQSPTRSGEQNGEEASPARARSKRPIFKATRFVVFEWMLDDLRKLLGPHFEAFDVHAWFYELSEQVDRAGIVVPQRDGGKWLLEQTTQEALRRGLPVATTQPTNSKTAGNLTALQAFAAKGRPV